MISTVTIRNLHLDAISDLLEDGNCDYEYLVIAHQDMILESCLTSAFSGTKAAMYQVPQNIWNMEEEDLSEAIQWAVEIGKIKKIMLVGSSSATVPKEDSQSTDTNWGKSSERPSLTERVRNAVVARQGAQDHFLSQLQALLSVPELASRLSDGELTIDGVFYRAESELFTYFDEKTNSLAAIN